MGKVVPSPLPPPNLTFPSACGVRWAGCPHRPGVSHSRWLAHLLLGRGRKQGPGVLSVGVWLSSPVPLSPASCLTQGLKDTAALG